MMSWRGIAFRIALSGAVSAASLALILHLVASGRVTSGREMVFAAIHAAVPSLLLLYLILDAIQSWFRAARNGLLLRASGEKNVPGPLHLYIVALTRNMFSDLLPVRAGELSYVAFMNRLYAVSGEACVTSLALSLVFDLVALLLIIFLGILGALVVEAPAKWLASAAVALTVTVAAALVLLFAGLRALTSHLRRAPARLETSRLLAASVGFLDRLSNGFDVTRRAGVLPRTLLLSLAIRFCKYAGLYLVFLAVAAPSYPAMALIHPWRVLSVLLGAEAAASLPVPTLMSFGSYETGGAVGWTLHGIPAADAAICMLAIHVWSQIIDYSLGGVGLLLLTLLSGKTRAGEGVGHPSRKPRKWIPATLAAVFLAAATIFAGYECWRVREAGALVPPDPGVPVAGVQPQRADIQRLLGGRSGFLVWSSNRSGNHEIHLMTLPDLAQHQLTHDPHVDYYPRLSPDGKRIVFARSQPVWASVRNDVPWNVWLMELDSGRESLLAKDGNAPAWADSGHVVFQRGGDQVILYDLAARSERVLFTSGKGNIPAGVTLGSPSFNMTNGMVALTLRGRRRMTAIADLSGSFREVDGGCQLIWSPDGSFLYYTGEDGRMKTAFYRYDPRSAESRQWLDMPTEYSHEYFPKLSNDGSILAFGASTGGHEHDTADYEIFLWKAGASPEESARLTYHTGNDAWPDVYLNAAVGR